ncbi:D-aminoacyl-tRNA deacylase [Bifidobacterium sp. 64T4]|uniref:D-aminoacyl-tRNA deacylase n=1 Tax=Bifidobacterium pongonis TaxID=2834432 RepID=UPI001C57A91D|nr:D-aminoacyl-tRNA deacylase [Bifidobacterium pongonis]MBW3094086.1 D-aminoacyl-tRNA deacylase [Bifidobacterium pongonis]
MRVILQRVREASVTALNALDGIDPTFDPQFIGPGLVLTVEIEPSDSESRISRMAHRILTLRCFEAADGRAMSVQEIGGEILSIPQPLTRLERTATGRPRLVSGDPDDERANIMWIRLNEALRSGGVPVREGRFGARMQVGMVADGPMNLTLTAD